MMMMMDEDEILETTPVANGACVIRCTDPQCGRPHIVFFDENNRPLFQFAVPAADATGNGFFETLKAAMEKRSN